MILSAPAIWRKFQLGAPLNASFEDEQTTQNGVKIHKIAYFGHEVEDGRVRIVAQFARPESPENVPAVLLLLDAEITAEERVELLEYFVKKGYAVLVPDLFGKRDGADESDCTTYPNSLVYANLQGADLYNVTKTAVETCWFEWTYAALYSVEYLKSRSDITGIGGAGLRLGGEVLWKTLLSPDFKCGIPISAAGWQTYFDYDKFSDNVERNMSDERHSYIAGIESQSYAPFVKCPVLMLGSMRDYHFDYDRAYDTFARIGIKEGSAIAYSPASGKGIGPNALLDMELFLEKYLKGREIFIPEELELSLTLNEDGSVVADVDCGTGGIVEEVGVFYAETGEESESAFREWQLVEKVDKQQIKDGKVSCSFTPFAGSTYTFAYAHAKYINGFKVVSKIAAKKLPAAAKRGAKSRMIYAGDRPDCFSVEDYKSFALGGIFLEREAVPKLLEGYGKITGVYSPGGIRTYRIGAPLYQAEENAMLEFDAYSKEDVEIIACVEVLKRGNKFIRYETSVPVKARGKWKRIILKAADFKSAETGEPLSSFSLGKALVFKQLGDEEKEFSVTNILWL